MAREVVAEIEDYVHSEFEVVGIVGVGGSPSCGVRTTLDLRRSLEVLAGCPVARLDRHTMNEQAIVACRVEGTGLFVAALRQKLPRKHQAVPWYEHDLLDEVEGRPAHLRRSMV